MEGDLAGIFAAACHATSWLVPACISVRLQGGGIKSVLFWLLCRNPFGS